VSIPLLTSHREHRRSDSKARRLGGNAASCFTPGLTPRHRSHSADAPALRWKPRTRLPHTTRLRPVGAKPPSRTTCASLQWTAHSALAGLVGTLASALRDSGPTPGPHAASGNGARSCAPVPPACFPPPHKCVLCPKPPRWVPAVSPRDTRPTARFIGHNSRLCLSGSGSVSHSLLMETQCPRHSPEASVPPSAPWGHAFNWSVQPER
jgi:hypothetical protein